MTIAKNSAFSKRLFLLFLSHKALYVLLFGCHRIARLRRNDEATYRCIAQNRAGSHYDERRISFTCTQPTDVDIIGDNADEMYELGKEIPSLIFLGSKTDVVLQSSYGAQMISKPQ